MLPGFDGSGRLFDLFEAELTKKQSNLNIISISYPAKEPLSYTELYALIEQQLPQANYILLAESFSGPLGIMLAANAIKLNLKGLILVGTFAKCPSITLSFLKPLIPVFSNLCYRLLKADNSIKKFIIQKLLLAIVFKKSSSAAFDKISKTLTALGEKTILKRLTEVANVDVSKDLSRIQVPALYLQANKDLVVPAKCANHISKNNPAVTVASISGGHLLLRSNPAKCAEIVAEFIQNNTVI